MIAIRQQFHHDAFLWVELAVSNLIVQVGLYYMQLVSPQFIDMIFFRGGGGGGGA